MLAPARHDCLAPRADLRRCLRGAGAAFTKLTWLGSILPATCRADREWESRNPAGQHAHTIVRAGTGSIGPTNQSNLQLRTQRGHPSAELESVAFFGIPCKVSARQRREREREREIERSRDREGDGGRGREGERDRTNGLTAKCRILRTRAVNSILNQTVPAGPLMSSRFSPGLNGRLKYQDKDMARSEYKLNRDDLAMYLRL